MKRIVRGIIVAALFAAAAAGAIAQQAPGPRKDRPSDEQREMAMRKMDAVRIARLTETLKLDEKTAASFIPVLTALEQKRRILLKESRDITQEMRALLQASPLDEGKLKAAISKIEKNRQEIATQRNKEFDAARRQLSIAQTARFIIFNQEFQQEMRGMMDGTRGARAGKAPDGRKSGKAITPGRGPGQGQRGGTGSGPPETR